MKTKPPKGVDITMSLKFMSLGNLKRVIELGEGRIGEEVKEREK